MATIGRPVGGPENGRGVISVGTIRACIYEGPPNHGWVREFRGWLGDTGSNANVRFGLHEVGSPIGDRIAYSAQASVTALYTDITGGDEVVAAIAVNDRGPTTKGAPVFAGVPLAIDILAITNSVAHSMKAAAEIDVLDENFYDRAGVGSIPPDPYGATVGVNNGNMSVWVVFDANEPPTVPVERSPSGTITSSAPTFNAAFRDRNGTWGPGNGGADAGDQLKAYQIQLRAQGTSTLLWNSTYDSNSTERAADQVQRPYGGTPLAPGDDLEWRVRVQDWHGAWSGWSSWLQFSVAAAGYVTLDGNPAGSRNTDVTMDFQGRWSHATGKDMDTVRVRLLDFTTNDVLKTSGFIAKIVASSALPGTLFTILAAETTVSNLEFNKRYKYQMQAEDEDGVLTDWSERRAFSTNFAPTVPSNLTPVSQGPYTDFPLITGKWTDEDDTPAGSGSGTQNLTGVFRITRPDMSTVDVVPTWNGTTERFEFQTTGAELTAFGTYSFVAVGFDGQLYSGTKTSLGTATWSGSRTFIYADGPEVTVDSPLDGAVIPGASFDVEFTADPHTKYRVTLYEDGSPETTYDTGWVSSAGGSPHTIPGGSYDNETAYDLVVGVEDSLGLQGLSDIVNISVSYVPPPSLVNGQGEPYTVGGERFATGIVVSWDPTGLGEEWQFYAIRRSADSGPDQAEILLALVSSASETIFVDYTPASGHTYRYYLSQMTMEDDVLLESDPIEVSASITLEATVLTSTTDPAGHRSILPFTGAGRAHRRRLDEALYQPPARLTPTTVRRRTRYWEIPIAAQLITARGYDADASLDALLDLEAMATEADGIGSPEVVCYRDEDGRKRFVVFTNDFEIEDELPDWYTATMTLREEHYVEGVIS